MKIRKMKIKRKFSYTLWRILKDTFVALSISQIHRVLHKKFTNNKIFENEEKKIREMKIKINFSYALWSILQGYVM